MAKMLTKVWKTAQGIFLETQKEALEYERRAQINEIVGEAWKSCVEAEREREKKRELESRARDWPYSGSQHYRTTYLQPTGFVSALTTKLEEAGLLPPIQVADD